MINTNVDEKLPDEDYIKACISDSFYAFIHTLKTQYWLLLSSLRHAEKLKKLKIITQGYDYVIPSLKKWRGPDLIQWIINQFFTSTGDWLCTPLKLKGLHDQQRQEKVIRHFIDEVNKMFSWLAKCPNLDSKSKEKYQFPNLYHIDCRGVARNFNDWFDEIHLKSSRFREIALIYRHIIFEKPVNGSGIPFDKDRKVVSVMNPGA